MEEETEKLEEIDGEDSKGEDVPAGLLQGSKGIRQWPINGCISAILSHKITPSVD